MITAVALGLLVVVSWIVFVVQRLGLLQRLRLAFGRISLEAIPDRAAHRYGDRVLFTTDEPCTWSVPALSKLYPDPREWSARRIQATGGFLATMLKEQLKVRPGDRIAILKENHFDNHVLMVGIVRSGAIACPINGNFAAEYLPGYLAHLGARILFCDTPTLRRVIEEKGSFGSVGRIVLTDRSRDLLADSAVSALSGVEVLCLEDLLVGVTVESPAAPRTEDEPVYLVHSSGTTGAPKAVTLRNGRQSHAVRGWLSFVHVSRRLDKSYFAVPNNHQAVILSFNSALLLGLPVHWIRAYGRDGFNAERVVRELAHGRFTGFFGFPITYTQLATVRLADFDLSRMIFWGTTADASHEAIERLFVRHGGAFRRVGLPFSGSVFLDAQGSSEVGAPSVLRYITRLTRRFDRRIGRPGSAPFGPRVRVVRPDGELAGRDQVGRLEVRGKTVFDGYWESPELTSRAFRDGWFFTGDMVRRGLDGHLVQLDREVDVIRTSAGDVYSLPIEEKLHKHPAVFDLCVYGKRLADGTQRPAAAAALRPGFKLWSEDLRQQLNAMLLPEERLEALEILPWSEFPIGVTGKTLKRIFREKSERAIESTAGRPALVAVH